MSSYQLLNMNPNQKQENDALGTNNTAWGRFIYYITYPKYETAHYNVNGLNKYQSSYTIISTLGMFLYLMFIFFFYLIPLIDGFYGGFNSTTINYDNLVNNLNLKANKTDDGTIDTDSLW